MGSLAAPRVYARQMDSRQQRQCEIVYVRERAGAGWRWRAVSASGTQRSSKDIYPLFHDCVTAAHASGYVPSGVLPVHYQ